MTIYNGMAELEKCSPGGGKARMGVAGRPSLFSANSKMLDEFIRLIEPCTYGDPKTPLRHCNLSQEKIASELRRKGFATTGKTVAKCLAELGCRRKRNRKRLSGSDNPYRNSQFEFIKAHTQIFLEGGEPVMSIDTKKKKSIGNFANPGTRCGDSSATTDVKDHDFKDLDLGTAVPYGVYDAGGNKGFVNIGADHGASSFAVNSMRSWLIHQGAADYPGMERLLIMADGGGSNGCRIRLRKVELAKLAREFGIEAHVFHYPSGTSKWNKIEHALLCFITQNWRAHPLRPFQVMKRLMESNRTTKGLVVSAIIDKGSYPPGVKAGDDEFASVPIRKNVFQGMWSYIIFPSFEAAEKHIVEGLELSAKAQETALLDGRMRFIALLKKIAAKKA
jgi:hypothetical protein